MTKYNERFIPIKNLHPVFCRVWSPSHPRITVLCIHGTGGNSGDFIKLAENLSSEVQDFPVEVLAFDAPGNGYSSQNLSVSNFNVQVGLIEIFIKNSKNPVAIIASSGGAIASFIALYANKKNPIYSSIPVVFSEPGFGFDDTTAEYIKNCEPFFMEQFIDLDSAVKAWDKTPLLHVLFDHPSDKLFFIKNRLKILEKNMVAATRKINLSEMKHFNILQNKSSFPNPSLLLWGDQGGLLERYDETFSSLSVKSQKIVFHNAGHPLSLTRKLEIEAISSFLKKHIAKNHDK
jgi:pimeloyl-ACP methyl ester carboxylesterase